METAIRCYVDTEKTRIEPPEKVWHNKRLVLVFDTETTSDEYQNLLYGSCFVFSNGKPMSRSYSTMKI